MSSRASRIWRHIITDHTDARRVLAKADLDRIEASIAQGERLHRGQLCLAVEPALPLSRVFRGVTPRERALEVFGLMRVWDTDENCGVLVYLLLADRDVEIIADRGIHRIVGETAWQEICATMEASFRQGRFGRGIDAGVASINALLARHFPRTDAGPNELGNRPRIL